MKYYSTNREYAMTTEDLVREYVDKQLFENNVSKTFPNDVATITAETLTPAKCERREDLRNLQCFTIDCESTKDMDDAISLERIDGAYRLGVHIADVAAYIQPGTVLDNIAMTRGYSIYLPYETIPMLPAVLSDELCSLNPGVDRLAVSVLIDITVDGNVYDYRITKSTIRSHLKGTYSKVNSILNGTALESVEAEYRPVKDTLFYMHDLASCLRSARIQNGMICADDGEDKIYLNGWTLEINHHERGDAEHMIEEFMILANQIIAEHFLKNGLPVVYRTQAEKGKMGTYSTEEGRHAELNLDHYAHFTSPIRRLADLKIHQVLTMHLEGKTAAEIHIYFDEHLIEAADRAKRCKGRASNIMKTCQKKCIKLWVEMQPQAEFQARVVGINQQRKAIVEIIPYRFRATGMAASVFHGQSIFTCKLRTSLTNNNLTAVALA